MARTRINARESFTVGSVSICPARYSIIDERTDARLAPGHFFHGTLSVFSLRYANTNTVGWEFEERNRRSPRGESVGRPNPTLPG